MENKKLSIIIAVVVVIVIVFSFVATSNIDKEGEVVLFASQILVQEAQAESAAVKDEEKKDLIEINVDEYLNICEGDKKTLVYLGSTSCGYCAIATPIIQNMAYKYDLDIYYLNMEKFDAEDRENFILSNEIFSGDFGTPMLLLVSKEEIHDTVNGLVNTAGYVSFLETNEMI